MLILKRDKEPDESRSILPSDRWTTTVSTEHTSYPASNLTSDDLGKYWRAWGQRRSHALLQSQVSFAEGNVPSIDVVSLLGINRTYPRQPNVGDITFLPNRARLIIDYFPETAYNPRVQPGGFSATNLTGLYSVLNQVINPPEEEIVGGYTPDALSAVSHSLDTSVTLSLGNYPLRPIREGADLQEFQVHVRDSVDKNTFPEITLTLRQGGIDLVELDYETIEKSSEGYIYRYLWDGSELTDTADTVEVRIDGLTTGSSTVEYLSFVWHAEVVGTLYDTDWQTISDGKKLVWSPEVIPEPGDLYVIIQLSDFGYVSPLTIVRPLGGFVGVLSYTSLSPSDSFHAGRFAAGECIKAPIRSPGGFNLRKIGNNSGSLDSSFGGQLRAARQDLTRWQADCTITPQSEARLFGELDRFFGNVGFVLSTLYVVGEVALWALITSFECPDVGPMLGVDSDLLLLAQVEEDNRYDVKLSIVESQATLTAIG